MHHYFYHPVTFFAVTKVIDQPVELSGKPLQDYINGKNLTVNRATNKIIETWIRIPVIISPIPLSINDLSNWTSFDLICSNENLKWITLVVCKIFGIQYLTYLYTSKYGAPINNDLDFCCSQRYWYNCDVILYYTVNKSYSSANKTILLIELFFNIISYFFSPGILSWLLT